MEIVVKEGQMMNWIVNNFSLNMIQEKREYSLQIIPMTELAFRVESKTAKNCLSQMDICQELDLFPRKGTVAANIGDTIFVAQYWNGELTYRKVIVGDIQ